jgi:penicillin-binding protein 1C
MALSTEEHLQAALGHVRTTDGPRIGYKTGTSFGLRDAWAVAFSPSVVVGIWLGVPRGHGRADLVGVERAAPLALSIARELSESDRSDWPAADALVEREICAVSGFPPGRHCPTRDRALQGVASTRLPTCRVHRLVLVDVEKHVEVCARCVDGREPRSEVVEVWPPEVERWMRTTGRLSARPPHDESCSRPAERRDGPRILSPQNGARYRLLTGAPFEQKLHLVAAAGADSTELFWFVNGELFASGEGVEEVAWKLSAGKHRVRCVDGRGRGATATFVVER